MGIQEAVELLDRIVGDLRALVTRRAGAAQSLTGTQGRLWAAQRAHLLCGGLAHAPGGRSWRDFAQRRQVGSSSLSGAFAERAAI